ncbi:MAG TPA: DUF885 domain-containing protein [Acidimicrobiia bacterium]
MSEDLRRIGDEYWEYQLEVSPSTAFMMGDHRHDDRHEDASRAAEDEEIGRLKAFTARAVAIDPAGLSADDRISREVLIYEAETTASVLEMRTAEMAVSHTVGAQALLPVLVSQLPIERPEHAEALLVKFAGIGRWFRDSVDRLREGIARGRTPMGSTVEKTIAQIDAELATPVADSPLLGVRTPASFDEDAVAEYKGRVAAAITEHVRPAFAVFREALADEVLPASRPDDRPGLSWLSDGEETYARLVHRHTTLAMDPREIHTIGLQQIDKLEDEYRGLGDEVLGTTDLTEIFNRLRDDADLHFADGPAVVAASEAAMAKAKAAMGGWFGRLPKADCEVKETLTGPTAFYNRPAIDGSRPGTFFVNTAEPARWGRFEIEAMAYHEGIPGHHLQLAIAQELEDVPMFRKHAHVTAYAEGWGLYTERLADEMGLYTGPLERIGMLSADSMRAGRLVVDTGLHSMGWTRQQAVDYIAANSPMSLATIEGEVDRYIAMPGQALAYMIGRLEIMRMRAEAAKSMGDRFDIKAFHDVVLGSGLVPLETLDRMVAEWAAA